VCVEHSEGIAEAFPQQAFDGGACILVDMPMNKQISGQVGTYVVKVFCFFSSEKKILS
jgi:hypothetical protein